MKYKKEGNPVSFKTTHKTSIIILTYNQLEFTKRCIDSIRKNTPEDIEIIVVDNHSTDGTVEYLKSQSAIRTVFNNTNLGFAKGCNQGYEIASGESIVFLNNDTVVTKNWLRNMLKVLYSDKHVGMVGPVSNYVSGPQQVPVTYKDLNELDSFAEEITKKNKNLHKLSIRLVGFCLLVKRTVLEKIGLFDEIFGLGSFEDDDISLRALQNGFKLMITFDSFVHHHGHATYQGNAELTMNWENYPKFVQKWGADLTTSHEDILQLIPLNAKKILDINCGFGIKGVELLNRQDCKVYGIEQNSILRQIARTNYHQVISTNMDELNLSFDTGNFDVILFSKLHEAQNPWVFIKKITEILNPHGIIAGSIPNITNHEVLIPYLQGDWDYKNNGSPGYDTLRFFSEKTIKALFPSEFFQSDIIPILDTEWPKNVHLFLLEIMHQGKKFGLNIENLDKNARISHFLIRALKKVT